MYEKEIRVAFPITTSKTSFKEKIAGEKSIRQVAEMIFTKAGKSADKTDPSYLTALRRAAESYRFIDRAKRVLDVKSDFYRAFILNKVQFLAAEVLDMDVYGNKDCYIKVKFFGNDKDYNGTVQIPAETYYRLFDQNAIDTARSIYIIGTCIRKEYKLGERKKWDRYSMKMQKVSNETVQKRTKMLHFYLGNCIMQDQL